MAFRYFGVTDGHNREAARAVPELHGSVVAGPVRSSGASTARVTAAESKVRKRPERLDEEREHPERFSTADLGSRTTRKVAKGGDGDDEFSESADDNRALLRAR